jgi:HSP20 family protein
MITRAISRAAASPAALRTAARAPVAMQLKQLSSKPRKATESASSSSAETQPAETRPARELTRRDPMFRQMGMLHSHFQQMFDELERDFFGPNFPLSMSPWRSGGFGLMGERALGTMPMDVSETDNQYAISIEIPGANKDELHVNVEDGVLTVSTEKKEEHTEKTSKFHRMERSYGRVQRSLRLPDDADADKIDASYTDGVLKITIPKSETVESRGKRIPIK